MRVGDYELEDGPKPRGYTTRGKVEQQRTAAPVFTGLVRKWEKRPVQQGHLTVIKWERVQETATEAAARNNASADSSSAGGDPSRKRMRSSVG